MCGCRGSDTFRDTGQHDRYCECSCHRGIVDSEFRCALYLDAENENADIIRCARRAGHDGMHKGYGIGWPAAEYEWSSDDTWPGTDDHQGIRPDHYGGPDNPYEVIKVIHAWGLGFDLGNVVKYVARAGKKHTEKAVEDLEKAKTYIDFAIDQIKKKDAEGPF